MKRRYKRELYAERVAKIKSLMPDCCIGVDVIVGHPGETRELFEESYQFLNELEISYLHVFTYSERENTTALTIRPIVPKGDRAERSKMLHILSEKKKRFFYEEQISKTATVLFEDEIQNGQMLGFTENYIRVAVKYDPLLINETKEIRYDHVNEDGFMEVTELEEEVLHAH